MPTNWPPPDLASIGTQISQNNSVHPSESWRAKGDAWQYTRRPAWVLPRGVSHSFPPPACISKRDMSNRYADWLRQADADRRHAQHALEAGDFEWSCFAAHQAAEKALKAVPQKAGMDAWGHTLTVLAGNLPSSSGAPEDLEAWVRALDKHYILTRDPNGFPSGAPTDFHTQEEARSALAFADGIIAFCRDQVG